VRHQTSVFHSLLTFVKGEMLGGGKCGERKGADELVRKFKTRQPFRRRYVMANLLATPVPGSPLLLFKIRRMGGEKEKGSPTAGGKGPAPLHFLLRYAETTRGGGEGLLRKKEEGDPPGQSLQCGGGRLIDSNYPCILGHRERKGGSGGKVVRTRPISRL